MRQFLFKVGEALARKVCQNASGNVPNMHSANGFWEERVQQFGFIKLLTQQCMNMIPYVVFFV